MYNRRFYAFPFHTFRGGTFCDASFCHPYIDSTATG